MTAINSTKNKMIANWPFVAGLFILLIGFKLVSAGESLVGGEETAAYAPKRELVEVHRVGAAEDSYTIVASGRLKPQNTLEVVGEVSGKVTYLNPLLKTGGRLEKGDVLFQINTVTYKADLARAEAGLYSAEAALVRANADYKRATDLRVSGTVSQAALDAAKAAKLAAEAGLKQAAAQLALAQEMLDRTVLKAPFDGLVLSENLTLGSYVSPGVKLLELMDARLGEVAVSLTQDQVRAVGHTYLSGGSQPIPVTAVPASGSVGEMSLNGYIRRLSPKIDAMTRTAEVIAEFEDVFLKENAGRVFADDYVSLVISAVTPEPVYLVPEAAVRKNAYVWIIGANSKLMKTPVSVLSSEDGVTRISTDTPLSGKSVMVTVLSEEIDGKQVRISDK